MNLESKFAHIKELYLPYEFKLLLRGSRDSGFTPDRFHAICDNIPRTVAFIKLKETDEIFGGYNPLIWKVSRDGEWDKTEESFIFSLKSKNNFKEPVLSRISNNNEALIYSVGCGPAFSTDLILRVKESDGSKEYNVSRCIQRSYEKKLRDTEEFFSIEDYEIFQIIKK